MTPLLSLNFVLRTLFLLSPHILLQVVDAGPGPCHPYPGAAATDCLRLIGQNLNNDETLSCGSSPGTITLDSCSITMKCTAGPRTIEQSLIVRRALTTIGACALSDYGSISGYYYSDDDGTKTCYLYPGQ